MRRVRAAFGAAQERGAALGGDRSGRQDGADLAGGDDPAGRDLRQAGDPGDVADQRQQPVVVAGGVAVAERSPVRACLDALHAEQVRAGRCGGLRFGRTGYRHRDDGACCAELGHDLGRGTAEGEADHRRRRSQHGRELVRPAVVVPHRLPDGAAGGHGVFGQRYQVGGDPFRLRRGVPWNEEIDSERPRRRGPDLIDLGHDSARRLIARGEETDRAGLGRGGNQCRVRRAAGHRRDDHRQPEQVSQLVHGHGPMIPAGPPAANAACPPAVPSTAPGPGTGHRSRIVEIR